MQHHIHVCSNGLTAVIASEPAHPVLSLQFWVETGSVHEGEWQGAGLSHLLEHMVFKGTRSYSALQLNEKVAALGGAWNAYTTTDRTVFYIDGPAEHWREYLNLLTELVFFPIFPEEEWEREREVIRREMDMYNDDPQDAAYHALIGTLFKRHPRRLPVIGERTLFDALSHADMLAYYRRRYVPGKVFVCVAGDIDTKAFTQALEDEMQSIPARTAAETPHTPEPRQWGPRLQRLEFAQPTTTLMLAWRIPASDHPDTPALSMLSSLLGDGRSAWLYKHFHDELGLVHDIAAYTLPHEEGEGALVVEADAERENRDSLRDALVEYMAALPQLPAEAFRQARARVLHQHRALRARSCASVQKLAARLGSYWHRFRNPDLDDEWESALCGTGAEELKRVAATYFGSERLVEVSVDPLGTNPSSGTEDTRTACPAPQAFTLPNGLRLVVREEHRLPLCAATLAFGAGCPTETAATAGINNLMAECLLKGTPSRSAAELAETMESLGGSINCNAGNNTLTMDARCLHEDVPTMLRLLADAALHPLFPSDAVEQVKKDMVADILDSQEDPASLAFRRLRRLCFGDVSYGNHPDGTQESVESLRRDDLVAHHARLCCSRNAVLCVAGDIDTAAVRTLAEELFADMPAGRPVQRTSTPPQQAAEELVACNKEQAVIALALPGLPVLSADDVLLSLFNDWCRDMSGPVFSEIREKRGLAYYASTSTLLGVDAGCLCFYLGTHPQQVAQARAALEQLLAALAEQGMPPAALERTRATALSSCLMTAQDVTKLCSATAVDTLLGLGGDYIDHMPARLRAVTHDRMQAFLRRLLSPAAPRTWCTVQAEG